MLYMVKSIVIRIDHKIHISLVKSDYLIQNVDVDENDEMTLAATSSYLQSVNKLPSHTTAVGQ